MLKRILMKGFIALDIDGTLTHKKDDISKKVKSYLKSLHSLGWKIIIITGKPYKKAFNMISGLDFPYIFSSQNGASAWHMPQKKNIFRRHLKRDILKKIEDNIRDIDIGMSAWGEDDYCYSSKKNKNFLHNYESSFIEGFEIENYLLVKCIGLKEDIKKAKWKLKNFDIEIAHVKDAFIKNNHLLLITQKDVNKGSAIKLLSSKKSLIIAAGNDENDLSMYDIADIKIAMEDSFSKNLLKKADIISASARKNGIIDALNRALKFKKNFISS